MADNDIIDFYKKADNDNKPEESLKEQVETPEPVVSEAVAVSIPESNDPFNKFLYNLADKIKDSKPVPTSVIIETKEELEPQDEPFNKFLLELADKLQSEKVITKYQQETLAEQVKQPISTDPDEDDPFKSFIGSFANILKQDELINREENIKEATINFINKLKEQPEEPFIIQDEIKIKPKVNSKKYLPSTLTKKTHKQTQLTKQEEPVVQEQSDILIVPEAQPKDNSYVKELKQADKNKIQIKKDKATTDIKSVVEKQVAEILSRYPNLGFTGGGGGTNAVQYAEGGTMNGNLTVNGTINATTYLSGGINLYNLLSSSGGGGSQTLTYSSLTEELSISNGNSVSLSSLSDKSYADTNFLKLSGGTITGNLSVYGNTFINNNLTVGGNLTALGTATFANTIFTTTSALSVVNTGPGPALYVYQASGPYDVASFYDGDGIEVLHVGNAGPGGFGKVGVNESFPNEELTVRGSISATESIFATSILSGGVDLLDIFGSPTDRLINGSYQVVLSSNGDLALSGAIVTASNSKLDLVGFGPNTAYLTTTPDDSTALFMGANVAELRANTYVSVATNTSDITHLWEFGADGGLKFPDNTTQTTAFTGNPDPQTLSYTASSAELSISNGNTVNLSSLQPQVRQFDYVVQNSISYNYCGTAPNNSLTTDNTWTIKRLLFTSAGTLLSSGTVNNSIWDNRYSYSY